MMKNNEKNKCTLIDILMYIHDGEFIFLKTDTMEIVDPWDYLKEYLPENHSSTNWEKLPSLDLLNIYPLPCYEFINHKVIMSEFAKGILDDKQTRQELFYVLRNYDYMDEFYKCLKKHNLYSEYYDYSSDYYNHVFSEWCKIHDIKFFSDK